MVKCWWIVMRNSLGCEGERQPVPQSMGEEVLKKVFLGMVQGAELEIGDTYTIEEGETEHGEG